ncbi:MAG: ECF transporter S component [Firmicutes bacterium]|nr:ECF transporter S component [Bacillota bacterium]
MEKRARFLKAFSVYDLLLIAMLTALAVAFKVAVKMLIGFIATPLGIPGGSLAGGLYMLWMPLALGLVKKRGAALLMTLTQSLTLFITGMPGGHGAWTFPIYMIPALIVEIVFLFSRSGKFNIIHFIAACCLANVAGTIGSDILYFRVIDSLFLNLGSLAIAVFLLGSAAFSGAVGGVLGYLVYKSADKSGLISKITGEVAAAEKTPSYVVESASPLEVMQNTEGEI